MQCRLHAIDYDFTGEFGASIRLLIFDITFPYGNDSPNGTPPQCHAPASTSVKMSPNRSVGWINCDNDFSTINMSFRRSIGPISASLFIPFCHSQRYVGVGRLLFSIVALDMVAASWMHYFWHRWIGPNRNLGKWRWRKKRRRILWTLVVWGGRISA